MKIKIQSEQIVKAVKKLDGIEVVLENPDDAREAIQLILAKPAFSATDDHPLLKDLKVTALQEYETSAVNYRQMFLLEFLFEDDAPLDKKVAFIKKFQGSFDKG